MSGRQSDDVLQFKRTSLNIEKNVVKLHKKGQIFPIMGNNVMSHATKKRILKMSIPLNSDNQRNLKTNFFLF
jgi:hypothetical protein